MEESVSRADKASNVSADSPIKMDIYKSRVIFTSCPLKSLPMKIKLVHNWMLLVYFH